VTVLSVIGLWDYDTNASDTIWWSVLSRGGSRACRAEAHASAL